MADPIDSIIVKRRTVAEFNLSSLNVYPVEYETGWTDDPRYASMTPFPGSERQVWCAQYGNSGWVTAYDETSPLSAIVMAFNASKRLDEEGFRHLHEVLGRWLTCGMPKSPPAWE